MKNTFSLEVMSIKRVLTNNEQHFYRAKLKHLLKLDGIISMCLEAENLYVEYNPDIFSLDSFKLVLMDIGLPLVRNVKLASIHYAV